MTRLIDADALLDEVDAVFGSVMSKKITDLITNAPTVQREHKYCGRKIDLSYGSTNCGSDFHGSIMKCDDCASEPTVQREGWVSVPIEPTEEMIQAACVNQAVSAFASYEKWAGSHSNGIVKKVRALEIDTYKAMIQAAPTDTE